ncbi:MAG: amidohydrolase family protein [Armatimonadetes bacterium]|nr:amidohydrolase family protein [Armatimonadota bacterium]MDW8027158.1 amidohydrolase family protein [Armatimonadota bacterium]
MGKKFSAKVLRAQWVVPITSPPVKDGAVLILNDTIFAFGKAKEVLKQAPSGAQKLEFPEGVLVPSLVNPHTHLENTHFFGIKKPQSFNSWLTQMVKLVKSQSFDDAFKAAKDGATQSLSYGVTCVGEFSRFGASFFALKKFGLKGTVFKEFICLNDSEIETKVAELESWLDAVKSQSSLLKVAVGPHAPYTVTPNAFKVVLDLAKSKDLQICIHAAESPSERKLVEGRKGIWRFWLGNVLDDAPLGLSPIRYLNWLGALNSKTLLVHCVQVDDNDIALLAERGVWVVHCPRSNFNLKVGMMPLAKMLSAGVKICLATDGLASTESLSPLDEIRFAIKLSDEHPKIYPSLSLSRWLRMVTLDSASAIGFEKEIGSIERGKHADLAVFKIGSAIDDPIEALVFEGKGAKLTMVSGEIVHLVAT